MMKETDNPKLYLPIFSEEGGVYGFFATKAGASAGSPYDRPDVLQKQGLEHMQLVWPQQVHRDHIAVVTAAHHGKRQTAEDAALAAPEAAQPIRFPETDGVITDVPGVLLTTVHADCLPVYFYDKAHPAIGLVHAGWRGSNLGIAPKAVKLMHKYYGSDPSEIRAVIGPGISSCCFEVGAEVVEAFCDHWSFAAAYVHPQGEGAGQTGLRQNVGKSSDHSEAAAQKYRLDLKGINRRQLLEAGLLPEHITVSEHCTHCEPELFCSYRREGGTYLRMGAGICLTEN